MKQRNNLKRLNKRSLPWQQVVFGYCLSVVFSFLFVFAQAFGTVNTQGSKCEARDNHSLLSGGSLDVDHLPIHPPIDSDPIPEPENQDGAEVKDGCDDEAGKLFCNFPSEKSFIQSCGVSLFLQLKLAIESRPQISLFILHHSWKSFLF